jgi:hypothetical protein
MKRSGPLRPKSKKTAKEDRELAPIRRAYAAKFHKTQVHEIVGGASRHKTKKDPRFWLPVDETDHPVIQYESKSKQMARKLVIDPENFDLEAVNAEYRSHGKEWPITFEQISQHLELKEE